MVYGTWRMLVKMIFANIFLSTCDPTFLDFRSLTFIYRYAIMLPKTEIIAALIIATVLHQGIAILCKIHQITLLYIFTICNLDTIYSQLNYHF